jgi:hypothetical protein
MKNWTFIPVALLLTAAELLMIPNERNCIKDTTGQKTWISDMKPYFKIDKIISFKTFKANCKLNKCTVNEACLSIFGQTLKEYSVLQGNSDLK